MLHIPPTNLLLLAAKQEPYKKSLSRNEKYLKNFLEKVQENEPAGRKKKGQDRKSNRTRQNRRGNSKVESNDSPEIPDRGGDIRHHRPPFGAIHKVTNT